MPFSLFAVMSACSFLLKKVTFIQKGCSSLCVIRHNSNLLFYITIRTSVPKMRCQSALPFHYCVILCSPLNKEKREGTFTCAGCGSPVFASSMKYDSGTGVSVTTVVGAFLLPAYPALRYPRHHARYVHRPLQTASV